MTVLESRQMLYSSVYSLHNIIDQPHMPGTYSQYNRVILPYLLPATLKSLEPNGVYLINNGEISMIYIGNSVDSQFLKNVWGANSTEELFNTPDKWSIQNLNTDESSRILMILEELRTRYPNSYTQIYYFFQGFSRQNYMLMKLMLEDSISTEISYEAFLMQTDKLALI